MASTPSEERLAAAQQPPPSPIEDPNWPMRCICSLCQCGEPKGFRSLANRKEKYPTKHSYSGHRCSNFAMDGDQQLRHFQQMRHCCNYTAANERYLTQAGAAGGKPSKLATSGEHQGRQVVGGAGNRTPRGRSSAAGREKAQGEGRRDAAEELLHVLVARPELARPRDNIIFEGSMDLKTTFETSYEALARMRLDHWRRYQELSRQAKATAKQEATVPAGKERGRVAKRQTSPAGPAEAEEANSSAADDGDAGKREEELKAAEEEERRRRTTNVSVEMSRRLAAGGGRGSSQSGTLDELTYGDEDCAELGQREQRPLVDCKGGRARQTARAPAGITTTDAAQSSGQSAGPRDEQLGDNDEDVRATASGPTKQRLGKQAATVPPATAASPQPTSAQIKTCNQQQQQQRQQQRTGDFIDPDLSPIIVYDANMNRLERVGLRKRSKYRPSTSLRTGTRGMFGDQRESADRMWALEEGQSDAVASGACDGLLSATESRQQVSPNAAGVTSHEEDSRCDSRNQKHMREFVSGLGADYNIQIEGKRRLPGNINMTDHIKEQHLVDNPKERHFENKATLTDPMRLDAVRERRNLGAALDEVSLDLVEREEQEKRLADEEEAAAVAELQRCTLQESTTTSRRDKPEVIDPQRPSGDVGQYQRVASRNSTRSTNSEMQRQSRMQRMCQNQSFYLFENEYPNSKGVIDEQNFKIGSGRDSGELMRQQQAVADSPNALRVAKKNLFRESPDFIMTTGTGESEAALEKRQSVVRHQIKSVESIEGRRSDLMNKRSADEECDDSNQQVDAHIATVVDTDRQNGSKASQLQDASGTAAAHRDTTSPRSDGHHKNGPCQKCRVLELEQYYEFVGLRSGHKYFVEKQLDAISTKEIIRD